MIDQEKSEAYLKGFEDGYNAKKKEIEDKRKMLQKNILLIEFIENLVMEYYAVSKVSLESKSRKREVREPRQIIMYLLKKVTGLSLKEIGERFGNRDHTTVINARTKVKDEVDTNEYFAEKVMSFEDDIKKYINTIAPYDKKIESAVSQLLS